MTIKELEREYKLRNPSGGGLELLFLIVFLLAIPLAIIRFNPIYIVMGIAAAIADGIVYNNKRAKKNAFLLDNRDKLTEDENNRLESYIRLHNLIG